MRILVFQHIECEHPGMLRTCLSEHDVVWDAAELDQGDSIPKLNDYDACVGTVELDIPRGYGRIIRFKNKIVEIVEEKDTTVDQRNIREVNTGVIAIKSTLLTKYLSLIKNNNIKKEFYYTFIFKKIKGKVNRLISY